jgi:3-methyladenine DNA glycosylase AlkD
MKSGEAAQAAEAFARDVGGMPIRNTPAIRALRRARTKAWRDRSAGFIHAVASALGERASLRWVGYELIRAHAGAFAALDDNAVATMAKGLDSWASVDAFARTLSGPAWARGLAPDQIIKGWAVSPERWLRRAALVSTVALNMPGDGGRGDAARTLAICSHLACDRDDMVEKALSWALRALSMREPAAVRAFLAEYDAALAARVRRDVAAKLATGLKNPRRRRAA